MIFHMHIWCGKPWGVFPGVPITSILGNYIKLLVTNLIYVCQNIFFLEFYYNINTWLFYMFSHL